MNFPLSDFLRILLILAGPAVGSFAALLADRLPRGEPVLMARSRCRSCGAKLSALQMIPLVSYPVLRGRCASCGASIPAHLWHAELLGLVLAIGAVFTADTALEAFLGAALLWCLLALALADLKHFRLPDQLTGSLLITALVLAIIRDDGEMFHRQLGMAVLGAALGFGVFWLIRLAYQWRMGREGLGLGDVKLMAGIGAAVGPIAIPHVTLLAGVSALLLVLLRNWRTGRKIRRTARVPFGAALSVSAALVWLAIQGRYL